MEKEEAPEQVFGQYPVGFLDKIVRPWLRCERSEVLHVCSGSLPAGEGIRVDVRRAARPDILADGRRLPLRDGCMKAVLIDPPYNDHYAEHLYGTDYPVPAQLLAEAARVVRPCGRIGFVHYFPPVAPKGCDFVAVKPFSTGFGMHIRVLTIYERAQDSLFGMLPRRNG